MNSFAKKVFRYEINPFTLTQIRESVGRSVEHFAEIVGWSSSYQYQLEQGKYLTISQETFNELRTAFARCGLDISEE